MLKRLIPILLVLSLLVTIFTGCSKEKKGDSVVGGDSSQTKTDKSSGDDSASKDADKSSAGDEVAEIYIFQNVGKVQSAGKPGSNPSDLEEVRQHILDKTGINVQVIIPPKDAVEQKLNIMLASNEKIDVFWGGWNNYIANDVIQPINEALDQYGADIKNSWSEEAWAGMTDKDGNIWGVPRAAPLAVYPVYLRMDWLEKQNLEMPKTIDDLEVILKAVKESDPAGNGETIPLATDLTGLNNCLAAGFMGVGYGNWVNSDGMINPPELHPGYKDFVVKMAEWYKKGYIFKEAFATNRDRYTELLKMGKIGGLAYWCSLTTIQSPFLTQNVPEAYYDFNKEGLQGPKGLCETTLGASSGGALIPKKSDNLENVIKFINWAYADVENHIIAENGLEGKHWEYTDKTNHTVKLISENYIGEFVASQGIALEVQYRFEDPIKAMHYEYLGSHILNLDRGVRRDDWNIIYDMKAIDDAVPTRGDLERLRTEEVTKFIMGARPIEEYDKFIEELNKAGLKDWIDEHTRQYNELSK